MHKTRFISRLLIILCIILMLFGASCVYADETDSTGATGSGSGSETGSTSGESTGDQNGKITSICYDPSADCLVVYSDKKGTTIWCAVVKKAEGSALQGKNFKSFDADRERWMNSKDYAALIPLSDKKNGFNISDSKDAYFYISTEAPKSGKETYKPNFTIHGCSTKLSKIELDYAGASKSEDYAYSVSALSSFTIKDGNGTEVYSKSTDYKKFIKELSNISYGQVWDNDEIECSDPVFYEDDVYHAIDRAGSTAPDNIYAHGLYYTGKLIYDPQNETGDVEKDCFNRENWVFEYDSTEKNRFYRFTVTTEISDDASEELKLHHNGSIHRYFYDGSFVWLSDSSFGIISIPQDKPALNGLKFTYMQEDTSSGREAGYYSVDPTTGQLKNPLVRLEDYGLSFYLHDYMRDDGEIVRDPDPSGLSILIEELPEAETAGDFGIDIGGKIWGQDVEKGQFLLIKAYPAFEFSCGTLREIISEVAWADYEGEKVKVVLYFRYMGQDNGDGKTAERSGKPVKVNLKKAGKRVKVTVDLNKDMVVVKNGFDFAVDDETWYTILPYHKDGTAKSPIVPTDEYTPVKKVTDNSDAFTSEKIKGIAVETLMSEYDASYITVRKSAKIGSPASFTGEEGGIELYRCETPCPEQEEGKDYLAVSDDKDTIKLPKIEDAETKDVMEYIVVDKKDFTAELANPGTIDLSSAKWTKYKAGGKITVGKTKSKYKLKAEDSVSDHILDDGSYVLIRKKGKKTTEKDDGRTYTWYELASDYYTTQVTKTTIEGADRYILSSATITVEFRVRDNRSMWYTVPRGGKIKEYMFPVIYKYDSLYKDFLGWADSENAESPNVTAATVFNTTESHVIIYAVFKNNSGNQSNSGESTGSAGSGSGEGN